jgi:hypothetical protein
LPMQVLPSVWLARGRSSIFSGGMGDRGRTTGAGLRRPGRTRHERARACPRIYGRHLHRPSRGAVVGGGLEILVDGPTGILFEHGFPPRSRPEGVYVYAYIIAWLMALVITYRPVFGTAPRSQPVSAALGPM